MSQVKKLTRLGGDTRKIAALLQAKAPKGEMLAYISPQEAALLKSRGGSGKPHADTGIPSFQNEFDDEPSLFGQSYSLPEMPAGPYQGQFDDSFAQQSFQPVSASQDLMQNPASDLFRISAISEGLDSPASRDAAVRDLMTDPRYGYLFEGTRFQPSGGAGPTPSVIAGRPADVAPPTSTEEPTGGGISKTVADALGIQAKDVPLLGIAGIQALLGSRQARQAMQQGQQARREMEAMAAPYRQKGEQLQAQAARGELTPQAQQSLQAVQAQAAQGVTARGGVGANQAAAQVEAVRQQLLQTQADYGLKLSGIADQIVTGAIREGMQADQFVNQLTSSYMNNIMRTIGGAYGQQQPMIVLGGGRP
jgi:hypothetical protein